MKKYKIYYICKYKLFKLKEFLGQKQKKTCNVMLTCFSQR